MSFWVVLLVVCLEFGWCLNVCWVGLLDVFLGFVCRPDFGLLGLCCLITFIGGFVWVCLCGCLGG